MPELPEVETVVRTLRQLVIGRKIHHVEVRLNRIIQRPEHPVLFAARLEGKTIERIERRGKFIRIVMEDLVLVSHLRMEGRYGLYSSDDEVEKHTHVLFHFEDGMQLRYKDVRQFGTMHLFDSGEEWNHPPLNKLGLEPLDDSFEMNRVKKLLAHRATKIKPLLLDQTYIVGLGNIYVDEALYRAKLHPEREANTLSPADWKKLHEAIVTTLQQAVDLGGSSIKSYVNGQGEMGMFQMQLRAYGKQGQPCDACLTPLIKTVVGGRGTHFCPSCQKLKRKK